MWWSPLESLPPWAVVALFPVFWIAASLQVARIGGWTRLSETYRYEGTFSGKKWRFRSGVLRWGMGYSNVLTIGANQQGLYLGVSLLFRLGHPALFFPWSDVVIVGPKGWFFKWTELSVAKVPGVPIRLPQELVNSITAEAGQHWRDPTSGILVQTKR